MPSCSLLANSLETAVLGDEGFIDLGRGPGSKAGEFINWLTIRDQRESVIEDVRRIRVLPLVPARIPIHGFVYQVETGLLIEIEEASAIGALEGGGEDQKGKAGIDGSFLAV